MTIFFDRFLATKNGFVPGIKLMTLLNDISSAVDEYSKGNLIKAITFTDSYEQLTIKN